MRTPLTTLTILAMSAPALAQVSEPPAEREGRVGAAVDGALAAAPPVRPERASEVAGGGSGRSARGPDPRLEASAEGGPGPRVEATVRDAQPATRAARAASRAPHARLGTEVGGLRLTNAEAEIDGRPGRVGSVGRLPWTAGAFRARPGAFTLAAEGAGPEPARRRPAMEPETEPEPLAARVEPLPSGSLALTIGGVVAFLAGSAVLFAGIVDYLRVEGASPGTEWAAIAGPFERTPVLQGIGYAVMGLGAALTVGGAIWLTQGGGSSGGARLQIGRAR